MRYSILGVHIPVLFFSLVCAVLFWYTFTVRERVDIQIELRVDYKNIPPHLVVTDGLLRKISVRLRGPEALLQNLPSSSLIQVVDLAELHKGENVIPFTTPDWVGALRAFDVQEIMPPRLVIVADDLQEHNMQVLVKTMSPFHSSTIKLKDMVAVPNNVLVRGPAGLLKKMQNIPVFVRIDTNASPGTYTQVIPLDTPLHVSTTPQEVSVKYTIISQRASISLERVVRVHAKEKQEYSIEPSIVQFSVEVPEALVGNATYLKQAVVSVTPPGLEVGQSVKVPIRLALPEGMTVLEGIPTEALITKIQ